MHLHKINCMTAKQIKTITQDFNGNLCVNGKRVGDSINMAFRVTTDSLEFWRDDAKERFAYLMGEQGKAVAAKAILDFVNK